MPPPESAELIWQADGPGAHALVICPPWRTHEPPQVIVFYNRKGKGRGQNLIPAFLFPFKIGDRSGIN